MGADDPSKLGLAEKNRKSGKPACRVFVFALPHSRSECTRALDFPLARRGGTGTRWLPRDTFLGKASGCTSHGRSRGVVLMGGP